jgi:archaeal preflagellin peptidase FlaK
MIISYIPSICVIIAIFSCIYASFSDLKRGIIPNKLTFPLIGIGLVLNGIYFGFLGEFYSIIGVVIITAIIFVLGYVFWKLGAWAGGDVKLFTALAALLPFSIYLVHYEIFGKSLPYFANYPFAFTIIINSILATLPFLMLFVFYIVYKNKRNLLSELSEPVRDYQKNMVLSLVVSSAVTLTLFLTPYIPFQVIILTFIIIYLLSLVISKLPNRVKAVLVSIVTVYAMYTNFQVAVSGIVIIFLSITIIGIFRKLLTTVNREALQDDVNIQDLKEGMIPAYNLYERDGEVYLDDKSLFTKFKEAAKTGDISSLTAPKGKLLIGALAAGLTKSDLDLLNKLLNEKKMEDKFRTKRGVPFAPAILIGLLISLFIGDLAIILVKGIQILMNYF